MKQNRYQECWHRHLHCTRNKDFLERTQIFIQNLRDKPKVLNNESMPLFAELPQMDMDESIRNVETFKQNTNITDQSISTSAQLIAKYYEHVGLLPSKAQINKKLAQLDQK